MLLKINIGKFTCIQGGSIVMGLNWLFCELAVCDWARKKQHVESCFFLTNQKLSIVLRFDTTVTSTRCLIW